MNIIKVRVVMILHTDHGTVAAVRTAAQQIRSSSGHFTFPHRFMEAGCMFRSHSPAFGNNPLNVHERGSRRQLWSLCHWLTSYRRAKTVLGENVMSQTQLTARRTATFGVGNRAMEIAGRPVRQHQLRRRR